MYMIHLYSIQVNRFNIKNGKEVLYFLAVYLYILLLLRFFANSELIESVFTGAMGFSAHEG